MLLSHPLIIKRVGAAPTRKFHAAPPCARSGRPMQLLRSAANPSFAWLWEDKTLADATLLLHITGKPAGAASPAALRVHRAVLGAHSEHFRTILLGGADGESQRAADFQPSTAVAHFIKTGSLPAGLTAQQLPQETFDSQAECHAASLVVRCMYEGKLAEELKDPSTLARVCRVAERWAFPSLCSTCLQRLTDLHPSQLPAKQLLLVLQTLPDGCALLPEHKKWQDRVHRLAGELNALPMMLHLYGDVHAVITNVKLRTAFQQLPFAAVQQWAGSDELTVDSENSVVELISLWMAGPVGKGCSWGEKEQLSCLVRVQHLSPAYALGRLPALDWFDIPEVLIEVVASAASCGCMEGLLNKALPAWSAAPRKQLDPAELLRRTTIRLDVPRQQLVYLLASEDLTAEVCSEPVYSAGAGWRVFLDLNKGTEDEDGFTLGCWLHLVPYAECKDHDLGAPLPHGTNLIYHINKGTSLGPDLSAVWVQEFWGELSFLDKSLATAADLDPFLEDDCLQITAAIHRPAPPRPAPPRPAPPRPAPPRPAPPRPAPPRPAPPRPAPPRPAPPRPAPPRPAPPRPAPPRPAPPRPAPPRPAPPRPAPPRPAPPRPAPPRPAPPRPAPPRPAPPRPAPPRPAPPRPAPPRPAPPRPAPPRPAPPRPAPPRPAPPRPAPPRPAPPRPAPPRPAPPRPAPPRPAPPRPAPPRPAPPRPAPPRPAPPRPPRPAPPRPAPPAPPRPAPPAPPRPAPPSSVLLSRTAVST
ncbi:hypothetical protein V8C86DRAFT_3131557 [Haematococcus lacustris]